MKGRVGILLDRQSISFKKIINALPPMSFFSILFDGLVNWIVKRNWGDDAFFPTFPGTAEVVPVSKPMLMDKPHSDVRVVAKPKFPRFNHELGIFLVPCVLFTIKLT